MYELVNDVESYPHFLPWCASATVHDRSDTRVIATIALAKGRLRQSFTTDNALDPGRGIRIHLVRGPFRYLHGVWRFEALADGGCLVSLEMEFDFASRLLAMTVGQVFSHLASSLVDSFRARAEVCYGSG